jgi:hypothetical protein
MAIALRRPTRSCCVACRNPARNEVILMNEKAI